MEHQCLGGCGGMLLQKNFRHYEVVGGGGGGGDDPPPNKPLT